MREVNGEGPAFRAGIRAAQAGVLVNAALAGAKLVAGIVGNSYALVADAVESAADVVGSFVVWGGLAVAARPADEDHPYGHGRAEALAAAAVSVLLAAAAIEIAAEAIRGIRTPHTAPAPWTLLVLVAVVAIKAVLARRVHRVGVGTGSGAVRADAWHHVSDALTSAAAFVGISAALLGTRLGGGPAWVAADDWAALLASGVILYNAGTLFVPALDDLMDRMPGGEVLDPVRRTALSVPGVLGIEKLIARKAGLTYRVTIHVEADPGMSLHDAHALGGRVRSTIEREVPAVGHVLVHMEPHGEPPAPWVTGPDA